MCYIDLMRLKTKLFIIGALILGGGLVQEFFKDTPALAWTAAYKGKINTLFQQALTLDPDKFAWDKGNRNPFTLLWQDSKETSLLTGTDGYGAWIETPHVFARLVSTLSGTYRVKHLYAAVQVIPRPGVTLNDIQVSVATVPNFPLQVAYPFSKTGTFSAPVFIPVFIDLTANTPLKIDADILVTSCRGTCQTKQIPVTLSLPLQTAYPTPLYAKMMYDAGIFPDSFPTAWQKSLSTGGILHLATDILIKSIHLYPQEAGITVTPLALFPTQAEFLVWPLTAGRHTFVVEVNRRHYTLPISTDTTIGPKTLPAMAHLKNRPAPFVILFLTPSGTPPWQSWILKLSGKIKKLVKDKQLKIMTLPAPGTTRAFVFGTKAPAGIEVAPLLSPTDWTRLIDSLH